MGRKQQQGDVTRKIPFPLRMINREIERKVTMRFPHVTFFLLPSQRHCLRNVSINLIKSRKNGESSDTIELFLLIACSSISTRNTFMCFPIKSAIKSTHMEPAEEKEIQQQNR